MPGLFAGQLVTLLVLARCSRLETWLALTNAASGGHVHTGIIGLPASSIHLDVVHINAAHINPGRPLKLMGSALRRCRGWHAWQQLVFLPGAPAIHDG